MDQFEDLHERIDALCRRAERDPDPYVIEEINDVLSEGYVRALLSERRVIALDERLVELLCSRDRSPELRAVADERRAATHCVARLRERLAHMREQFVLLGGT